MNIVEIIDKIKFIQDKNISISEDWFLHATSPSFDSIRKILSDGIKCAYLRNEESKGVFNGKYYVSIYKAKDFTNSEYNAFRYLPIFVLDEIEPVPTLNQSSLAKILINTKSSIRISTLKNKYQTYLEIKSQHIIALEYSVSHLLLPNYKLTTGRLNFLRELVLCLKEANLDLPIYDFNSKKEINKSKVLSLNLKQKNQPFD